MNPPTARPGDCLLYSKSDVFGCLTAFRTWSPAVHVEVYEGWGKSLASRNGLGVDRYDMRWPQLAAVLRPKQSVNFEAVGRWFDIWFDAKTGEGVRFRPYGWLDLLRFYGIKLPTQGWICSQFAAKLYQCAGLPAFAPEYYQGTIDPGDFFLSPAFDWTWVRPDVRKCLTT